MRISRRQWMRHLGFSTLGLAGCLCGCHSAPMTNRRQLMLLPEKHEVELGLKAYGEVLASEQPSSDKRLSEMVHRVGQRIAQVSGRSDFNWEFRLIASSTQNAFCLPGGKVAVYEGILPICQHESGLAVVMSHEVAHALARHGGERMSQAMVNSGAKQVLSKVVHARVPDSSERLMQAYGVISEYGVILPYSRKQESEADRIGVMLMAQAGYDPQQAPRFWQRFGDSGGSRQPEFMSTHPSDSRRAAELLAMMEQAMGIYRQTPRKHGLGEQIVAAAARA